MFFPNVKGVSRDFALAGTSLHQGMQDVGNVNLVVVRRNPQLRAAVTKERAKFASPDGQDLRKGSGRRLFLGQRGGLRKENYQDR